MQEQETQGVEALLYIEKLEDLPTLPSIASRVVSVTSETDTSVKAVASLIEKDMALSAKILQVINSSFYSFTREIISVSEAVSLMGFQQVGTLALGISVIENFTQERIFGFSYREFWERSVGHAVAATMTAARTESDLPNGVFTTALLQDIGTYVLVRYLPLAYGDAKGVARERCIHSVHAERQVMGTDHAEVGALLAERWNLPRPMHASIRHHHFFEFGPELDPEVEQDGMGALTKVINVSNLITDVLYEEDGEERRATLDERAGEYLGLDQRQLDEILDVLPGEIESVKSLFQLDRSLEAQPEAMEKTYHDLCPKCDSGFSVKFCGDCGTSLLRTDKKERGEGGNKVLVAEDSEAIRTAIVTLLRKRGYKIFIALNGEEAVEMARQEQPDLILMDIKMPVMDGIEALRLIRRDLRLQATPMVMLTSITNLNTVTEAIESGANDYIAKPFKVYKLLERVEKYVHASTPSSSESIGTAEEDEV